MINRPDLKHRDYAISIGYEIEYHAQDRINKRFENPIFPLTFKKGKRWIWETKNNWTCAELINGNFTNHKKYFELKTALDYERFGF